MSNIVTSVSRKVDPSMGEVRVQVKLTNAADETLVRRGKLEPNEVKSCVVEAMVDTGAVRSVLPATVVEQLGVLPVGPRMAQYADGRSEEVDLTEGIQFEILGRATLEEALVLGDEVLVGQTVLGKLDLWVDCAAQKLVPNPAHPDQQISKV